MIRSHELQGYGAFKYSSAFWYGNPLAEKPILAGLKDAISQFGVSKFVSLHGPRRPIQQQKPLEMVVPANVITLNVSELVFPSPMRVTAEGKGDSVIPSA